MWIVELLLMCVWMLGVAFSLTMGGWIHLFALAVLALVCIENTPLERRLRGWFAH